MVFYVVSGFCIHRTFRDGQGRPGWRFLARRYLRIGLPLLAALAIIHFFSPDNVAFDLFATSRAVVWSLVAEVIYYTIYPGLLAFRRRWGWTPLLAGAFLMAVLVILLKNPRASHPLVFGPWLTWLTGLPVWLVGCLLAEKCDESVSTVSTPAIWCWRMGMWMLAAASSVLVFHAHIGYPWTMLPFSVAIFFWLRAEIHFHWNRAAWIVTEWCGRWSYSIYAMHLVIPDFLRKAGIDPARSLPDWLAFLSLDLDRKSTRLNSSH